MLPSAAAAASEAVASAAEARERKAVLELAAAQRRIEVACVPAILQTMLRVRCVS